MSRLLLCAKFRIWLAPLVWASLGLILIWPTPMTLTWRSAKFGPALRKPDSFAQLEASPRRGYVADVYDERRHVGVVLPPPQFTPSADTSLYTAIYSEQLVSEFQKAYEQKFGYSEAERQLHGVKRSATDTESLAEASIVSQSDDLETRKEFGQYMLRRLSEYHIDNYARQKPSLKKAWEVKERLSNAKVQMSPGYSLSLNYRLSANRLDIKLVNPYIQSEVQWFLSEKDESGSPALIVNLGYDLNPRVRVHSYFKSLEKEWALVGEKDYGPITTASLTALTRLETTDLEQDNQVLAGIAWKY